MQKIAKHQLSGCPARVESCGISNFFKVTCGQWSNHGRCDWQFPEPCEPLAIKVFMCFQIKLGCQLHSILISHDFFFFAEVEQEGFYLRTRIWQIVRLRKVWTIRFLLLLKWCWLCWCLWSSLGFVLMPKVARTEPSKTRLNSKPT